VALVVVTFDGTNLSYAESEADGGTWDKYKASQSPTTDSDFIFQDTASIANNISNTTGGVEFEDDAAVDFTTPKVVVAKVMNANPGLIDLTVAKGASYEVGEGVNGATWSYEYDIAGLYAGDYPLMRSWLIMCIDPNEIAFRDDESGTVDLSTVDWYAWWMDAKSLAKGDNVIHDRLDWVTNGTGLTLLNGGGGNPEGTFADFLSEDYDDNTARYGIIHPGIAAETVVNGVLTIGGSATATLFTDQNQIIAFPFHKVGEGFSGIDVNMDHASNDINFTACTFKGLGQVATKRFFDTALEVEDAGAPDYITVLGHGLSTGDLVTYSVEGGSHNIGLTTATQYFVRVLDADTFALYAVGTSAGRQNSFTNTSPISLTTIAAPGENHSIILNPDNRPDHTVIGTTGVGVTWDSCSIDGCRVLTLTSKAGIDGGFVLRVGQIIASTASIENVSITTPTTTEGVALFTGLSTIGNILDNVITAGEFGHAFEITSGGSMASRNTYSGFWTPDDLGWNFDTLGGVDGVTDVITTDANHGFVDGDAVYYNDEGGTSDVGLVDATKYYVNAPTADTLTLHATKAAAVAGTSKIALNTDTTETHSLYGAHATLYNNSGTSATITVTTGSSTPSVRNGTGASTTVDVSVDVTVTVIDVGGDPVLSVQTAVYKTSDRTEIMNEDTIAGGIATVGYTGVTPVEVEVRCRKASGTPNYLDYSSIQTIGTGGLELTVTMRVDPNNQ